MTTELIERPATLSTLQTVGAMLANPDIDPDRAKGFLDIYERLQATEAAEEFGHAMAVFQSKCPPIFKSRSIDLGGGKGPTYAGLDDIMEVIKPILAECELSLSFSASVTDAGQMKVICSVRRGRHVEHSEITLAVPSQMRVNDTQKMGAALSYAKRYALCAALNIIVTDEDNDAAKLTETITEQQLATINEWIESTNTELKKFLHWLDIKSLADMTAAQYENALVTLKRKAAK